MDRSEIKSLKEIIENIRATDNGELNDKIDSARIPELWKEIAGIVISNSTEEMYFKHNKLYVSFDNPAIKCEVLYMKASLIFEMNKVQK